MNQSRIVIMAAILACAGGGIAHAQPPRDGPGASKGNEPSPAYVASKYDLARAYLRIERLMVERAATLSDADVVRVNRGVDSATNYFFRGDFSGATRVIVEQIVRLEGLNAQGAEGSARLLSVMDRPVVLAGQQAGFEASVRFIAEPAANSFPFVLKIEGVDAPLAMLAPAADETIRSSIPNTQWPAGTRRIQVQLENGRVIDMGAASVISLQMMDAWKGMQDTLGRIEAARPELTPSIRITRARLDLLIGSPTADSMAMYVLDPISLGTQVQDDIDRMARGEDPFKNFVGDRWMSFDNAGTLVPMRLSAPKRTGGEPMPLIIAVHGAGGDENLWMDGYGGGLLKTLAMERGCILATPQVGLSTFMPATFDAIVDGVRAAQNVDPSRMYLVGHSLGGGVITAWMKARADKVRATCSIAGVGALSGSKSLPPVLAIAGELDRVVAPGRIGPDASRARAAGHQVEYREIKNYGHTLVVGKVIPEMVDWLLAQPPAKAAPPTPPPTKP